MTNLITFPGIIELALSSARGARSFGVGPERAEAQAIAAQAEATAALALAIRSAGESIGMGLKSIADALARR